MRGRQFDDAVFVQTEHDAPHHRRGGVVQVHDDTLGAVQRLEGALDQFGPCLRQHLDRHIVGHQVALDQQTHEVEVGLRRRRKTDLDLLEADLRPACRTCAACGRCPSARSAPGCRRAGRRCTTRGARRQHGIGPAAIGQLHRREGPVLGLRVASTWLSSWIMFATRALAKQTARCGLHTGREIEKQLDVDDQRARWSPRSSASAIAFAERHGRQL